MATVLIVDDDVFFTRVIKDMVLRLGHRPVVARNGEDALDLARKETPQLVITDLVMKPVDGFELCRRLRDQEQFADLPVILMSARDTSENRLESAAVGAVAFLEKPFEFEELEARIRNLLAPKDARAQDFRKLRGDLAALEPELLIQGLNLQRKTGLLTLESDPPVRIWMREGDVFAAQCGDLLGVDAVLEIVGRREGKFEFDSSAVLPTDRNIGVSFLDLMMMFAVEA